MTQPISTLSDGATPAVAGDDGFAALARQHRERSVGSGRVDSDLGLGQLDRSMRALYSSLQDAGTAQAGTRAQEWLLDNRHVVQEALEQVRTHLPRNYLRLLPLVRTEGKPMQRVHELAHALLERGAKPVNPAFIEKAVEHYQTEVVLAIGELWALPAFLRLALLEDLACAAGSCLPQDRQTAEETERRSSEIPAAIISLRNLAAHDWRDSVERLSLVERTLRRDPTGAHARMDFATRNRYRSAIEELARGCGKSEPEVAEIVLAHCGAPDPGDHRSAHPGFYLISGGRRALERELGFRTHISRVLFEACLAAPSFIYFTLLSVFVVPLLMGIHFGLLHAGWQPVAALPVVALAAIPVIGLGVALLNGLVAWWLPPRLLPKLDLGKGIPPEFRTAVVTPVLLASADDVAHVLERTEINYLSNPDPQLVFVVLSDFADSVTEHLATDAALLEQARAGIEALNARYGAGGDGPFLLFHRRRRWNPTEGCWMGWERKRGKLVEFNLLLAGNAPASTTLVGKPERLSGVRYVITLDADTQLPPGSAQRLIGTLAHPLNRAVIDLQGSLKAGYSILQPRVDIDPGTSATRFAATFAGDTTFDLYTHASSDIYYDLFGEGIYTGKGIYDWHAFEHSLHTRIPDNALLSHDLLEGVHGRVALASDVALLEQYPTNPLIHMRRQHRWVRGDWQLLPWLSPLVPSTNGGWRRNPLTYIHQWKIVDNLRRSLQAPAVLLLLCAAWLALPGTTVLWTLGFASLLATPLIVELLGIVGPGLARPGSLPDRLRRAPAALRARLDHWLLTIVLLPYEAIVMADAIARTLLRLLITRRRLLEWTAAAHVQRRLGSGLRPGQVWREMWTSPATAAFVAIAVSWLNPGALPSAIPLLLLWAAAPQIAWWSCQRAHPAAPEMDAAQIRELRRIARRTWLFFERFVGPDDHWLPPDNFQEEPRQILARRTSPTNIGMSLVAALAAYDLGYLDATSLAARTRNTLDRMQRLERYRGHWLNWYDTRDLRPLEPRYVSTVDSGNLAASLMVLARGLEEIAVAPPDTGRLVKGVCDTVLALEEALGHTRFGASVTALADVWKILTPQDGPSPDWIGRLHDDALPRLHAQLLGMIEAGDKNLRTDELTALRTWLDELHRHVEGARRHLDGLGASQAGPQLSQHLVGELHAIAAKCEGFVSEMDFGFLYDHSRDLFRIGHNVTSGLPDANHYDLLASEARLAGFVAVAKGDAPMRHWLHLGRPFRRLGKSSVLMSWSATLFEYLMPRLFMVTPLGTLLEGACQSAIAAHRRFAEQRDLPWGISESGYYHLDSHSQYQYRAFGVPGIGFRRDLGDRIVVSPYSSVMALPFDAEAVLANLRRLEQLHALGPFGFYEAVDFGRVEKAAPRRARVVRSYMSHHQGMAFLALNNAINDDAMLRRFHADPRVAGVAMLLHERAPVTVPTPATWERSGAPRYFRADPQLETWPESPGGEGPRYNVLSNGHYTVTLSANGAGGSEWEGIALTRWQGDVSRDAGGSWIYVKDQDDDRQFSLGFEPAGGDPARCSVKFGPHVAEFQRREHRLFCHLRVALSSQHDIEVRKLTLRNESSRPRHLLVAACADVALAPAPEFERHPAFARLFVESELLAGGDGLLFHRRIRGIRDRALFMAHSVFVNEGVEHKLHWETDRQRFLGRGGHPARPRAVALGPAGFTGSTGPVLDAVMGSGVEITLAPYEEVEIAYLTGAGRSRTELLAALQSCRSMPRVDWVFEQAKMQTQQELHNLQIAPADLRDITQLLSAILAPRRSLRAASALRAVETPIQEILWSRGISGDAPILLVDLRSINDVGTVEQLLKAHTFWAGRQLAIDLVILDEESAGYAQPGRDRLQQTIAAIRARTQRRLAGGVTVVAGSELRPSDRAALLAAARVVVDTAQGAWSVSLPAQLPDNWMLPSFIPPGMPPSAPATSLLPRPTRLLFDNGLGGFTPDGREYVLHLEEGRLPPAPWSNVIANPGFGTLVTEGGTACTWCGNSSEQRLTPWVNDAAGDRSGEVLYLRDEETGRVWSPTPLPCPDDGAYQVRHGAGYSEWQHHSQGLRQVLRVCVDADAPVKICRLSLTNEWPWTRRITATYYCEWVLGGRRAETAPHVVCDFDAGASALLARNAFTRIAGGATAFLSASRAPHGVTTDRGEFLGPGGDVHAPASLDRIGLSGCLEAGVDPCGAYQVHFDIPAGATETVHFLLGQGRDRDEAVALAQRFRDPARAEAGCTDAVTAWRARIDTLRVETPEPALDLLVNQWLPYQVLACRMWGRTGYYQSSGAFGFRDQLQDAMTLLWAAPEQARAQILLAASRQFQDGDVMHWWHEAPLRGVRTRCSDDLLWLPYVTAHYLRCTGDDTVLQESVAYVAGAPLQPDEHEHYAEFFRASETGSLYEHCCRAIERATVVGQHGLPIIGSGDWNDGMNHVGAKGQGESVWLGWFLARVYDDFAQVCERRGDTALAARQRELARMLRARIEEAGWDGNWYRRAYYDDGTPLGSAINRECRIDLIAQTWSVLGAAAQTTPRARRAMRSAWDHLVRERERLVLLLAPPFDRTPKDPGYIKGYPPGIRENGGQYTHAAAWAVWAMAGLDDGERAMQLFRLLNPILRTTDQAGIDHYRVEPYVLAGDVYGVSPHTGRGGWTWYTGAAGWLYRAAVEALLGLRRRGDIVEVDPCLPAAWKRYRVWLRRGTASYAVTVDNPLGLCRGSPEVTLDGTRMEGARFPFVDDGQAHAVAVRLAPIENPAAVGAPG